MDCHSNDIDEWIIDHIIEKYEICDSNRSIPIEFKILMCLRILARGNVLDDIEEMSSGYTSTIHALFLQFCQGMVDSYFDDYRYIMLLFIYCHSNDIDEWVISHIIEKYEIGAPNRSMKKAGSSRMRPMKKDY
jgi:hypothetical protein